MSEEYQYLSFIYFIGLSATIIISSFTYYLSNKYSLVFYKRNSYLIFVFSFLFYTISVLILSFEKINALHHYVDFATHLEILWNNYKGNGLITLMSENFHESNHWFAVHFTPIIYLTYIPLFMIFPSPQIIPVSSTFFILSSLIPLWLVMKNYFNSNLSRVLLCSFLFYPTIFYTNLYGIAYIELCIPLFLWLFYFFEKKKNIFFVVTFILCLMIREEVALVISFFGLYMIFRKRYIFGLIIAIISLLYFYITINFIMPSFKSTDFQKIHISAVWFNEFGNTYTEVTKNILLNPIDTLKKILTLTKIGNFVMFLIPLLFIPLLNLPIFFIALPNLAISFLSSATTHSSFILYYLSPSIPIFFYATINGVFKIKNLKFINVNSLVNSILVASISTTIFFGATPISIAFWNKNYYVGNFYTTNFHRSAYVEEERDIIAKEIVNKIPNNAIVSAEQHLLPLLYNKKKIVAFPSDDKEIEYVVIDIMNPKKTGYGDNYLSFRLNPEKYYNKFIKNDDWLIVYENKGVTLLKKK